MCHKSIKWIMSSARNGGPWDLCQEHFVAAHTELGERIFKHLSLYSPTFVAAQRPQRPYFHNNSLYSPIFVAAQRPRRQYCHNSLYLPPMSLLTELGERIFKHLPIFVAAQRSQRRIFTTWLPLFTNIWCTELRDRIFTNLLLCLTTFGAQSTEAVFSQIYFSVYQNLVHRAPRPYFHKSTSLFINIWCTEVRDRILTNLVSLFTNTWCTGLRDRIFTNLLLCLPTFGAQSSETVFSQIYSLCLPSVVIYFARDLWS